VYLSTIVGAWLADRVAGSEHVPFASAVLIMLGHISLAVLPGFAGIGVGLGCVALGSGGLKANATGNSAANAHPATPPPTGRTFAPHKPASTNACSTPCAQALPPPTPAVMDLAEKHRQHLERWFHDHAPVIRNNERNGLNFDDVAPGLSQYIHNAIIANAERAASTP
jgi:hypothetical protein